MIFSRYFYNKNEFQKFLRFFFFFCVKGCGMETKKHHLEDFDSWGSIIIPEDPIPSYKGTIIGAIVNLSNVAIGAGLLSFPYVFHQTGIALGVILILGITVLLGILAEMLSFVCNEVHKQVPHLYLTYETVSDLVLGRKITVAVVGCVIITIFSSQIASLIIMGDMLEPIIEEYGKNTDEWWTGRAMVTALLCIVVFPLCCLKKIDHLRWTSGISILSLFLVCIIVVSFCIEAFVKEELLVNRGEIQFFNFTFDMFASLPIIAYAMAFHIQLPPVFLELSNSSVPKFRIVIIGTLAICVFLYSIVGMFGYAEFGELTEGNILQNYSSDSIFVNIARCCMTITALFSYPLMNFVNRKALEFIINNTAYLCFRDEEWKLAEHGKYYYIRTVFITFGLLCLAWVIAMIIPEIQLVFGLAGSFCIPFTIFLVPSALYWKVAKKAKTIKRIIIPLFITFIGFIIGILGAITTIQDIVEYFDDCSQPPC